VPYEESAPAPLAALPSDFAKPVSPLDEQGVTSKLCIALTKKNEGALYYGSQVENVGWQVPYEKSAPPPPTALPSDFAKPVSSLDEQGVTSKLCIALTKKNENALYYGRQVKNKGWKTSQPSGKMRHGGGKRFIALKPSDEIDIHSTLSTVLDKGGWRETTVYGGCVNHPSETEFAGGLTCAVLMSFENAEARDVAMEGAEFDVKAERDPRPVRLDYEPTVVKEGAVQYPALHHIFFAKFTEDAPMDELIAGYSGLTDIIPEMKSFEYAKLEPEKCGGYEYLFMTVFEDAADRDAYLEHPDHQAFGSKIISHTEKIVVIDFFEEDAN